MPLTNPAIEGPNEWKLVGVLGYWAEILIEKVNLGTQLIGEVMRLNSIRACLSAVPYIIGVLINRIHY